MTYDVGDPNPGLGQAQKCGEVKHVNGISIPPLDNCISNRNADINKRHKTYIDSHPLQSTTDYYHGPIFYIILVGRLFFFSPQTPHL